MALVTEMRLPSSSVLSSLAMHSSMSSFVSNVTKPKPRDLPVILSSMTRASTGPWAYFVKTATVGSMSEEPEAGSRFDKGMAEIDDFVFINQTHRASH